MEFLVPIVLFLCVTAVLVLRPLSKNVGRLLEEMARQRAQPALTESDAAALRQTLENLAKRLELMEDRLDFTERLLSSGQRRAATAAEPPDRDELARLLR